MLNCLLLSYLAMVEVEHEKGTHSRACRMLHLDNYSLKLMFYNLTYFTNVACNTLGVKHAFSIGIA